MAEKQLNDQQKLFLEVLFLEEVGGDAVKAKKLAGYSDNYPTSAIVRLLKDEILESTRQYLARMGPKAAFAMGDTLSNPTQLGVRDKQSAAKDILDRVGIVKTEKVEVSSNGIFILPKKDDP